VIPPPPGAKPIRGWVFLLLAAVYVIGMVIAATAFVWYLSSLPPPSGTHHERRQLPTA